MTSDVLFVDDVYTFPCPHCFGTVQVTQAEVACGIFRHGIMLENLEPMNPHADQATCESLVAEQKVRGCAKPFQLITATQPAQVRVCSYELQHAEAL